MTIKFGTEIYLKENLELRQLRQVLFAPKVAIPSRRNKPYSISWLIWKKLKALKGIKSYILEIIHGRSWLKSTYLMQKAFSEKFVIVCANGPSQGLIDYGTLKLAKSCGFHLIAMNFFLENKNFYEIKPDLVVISDWGTWREDIDVGDSNVSRKRQELRSYLKINSEIIIFCPARLADQIASEVGIDRTYGFSDSELLGWSNNINPLFPRGYHSMTAYKALALSLWLGYKTIYCIGFDNTYPREVFCDKNNRILERATHAYSEPYVRVLENCYENMGEYLSSIAENFHYLSVFPENSIINLDEFSLTDRFKKVTIKEFQNQLKNL
jgi:hypothetical protein